MAHESSSDGGFGRVSRRKVIALRIVLLASSLIGIVALAALLAYVTYQAFDLESASPAWFLVYFLTLVVPTAAVGAALRRRGGIRMGTENAVALWGGIMVAAGTGIFFVAVQPVTWFATVVPVALVAGLTAVLGRYTGVPETARLLLTAVLLGLALFGLPGVVPSVAALIGSLAMLPSDFIIVVLTLVLPGAAVVGSYVALIRDDRRDGYLGGGLTFAGVTAAGYGIGLQTGFSPGDAVLIPLFGLVPAAVHAWRAVESDERSAAGVALPATVVVGSLAGAAVADALSVTGPRPWLNWRFLTNLPNTSFPDTVGVFPAVVGSLLLMIVVVVFAFPVGVGAAVYLEEYAPANRLTRFIKVNISNLAGVPSVVYGLLGLAIFINTFGMEAGSIAVGGLALGLLILPIVIISAQEAIRSVPESARQASYGMGATRWQTVRNVVLPQAMPGILTGTILALGRAIGETAPLLMIAAPSLYLGVPDGFFAPAAAVPLQIYNLAFLPESAFRTGIVPAGVVTMLIILLTMNGIAIILRNRFQGSD
ncbi:MAG: phosphate ABC transporter permease PstA [Halobacteriaceae archaeon]